MSVIDQFRGTTVLDEHDIVHAPARDGMAAWAVLPAGAASLLVVALQSDLSRGASSSATVMVIVAMVLRLFQTSTSALLQHRAMRLASAGMVAGALAGVGQLVLGGGSAAGTAAATAMLGWLAVAFSIRRAQPDGPSPDANELSVATIAAMAAVVVGAAAVTLGAGHRPAVAVAVAVPAGLAMFLGITSLRTVSSDAITAVGRALLAGVAAAVLAMLAFEDGISTATVAATVAVSAVAATVLYAAAVGHRTVRRMTPVAIVIAFVAAGAADGAIALAALVPAIAVLRRSAVMTRPAVTDETVPTGTPTTTFATTRQPTGRPEVIARRVVAALTAVATGMRLYAGRGLWLDEATTVHQAELPFVDMLRLIHDTDVHPPLHHVVMWLDVRLVGNSELALRLPAVAMGALLVPMLFITGRELFDRRVGLIAAAIGAVAPIAVWYGQEARMYSQFMLLAIVSVYAMVKIIRTGRARHWVMFTAASVALVYTQYFATLHVGATLLVLVIELVRRRARERNTSRSMTRGLLASVATQIVLIAPLVPFAVNQAAANQAAGAGFSTSGIAGGSAVVPPPGVYGLLTNVQWAVLGYQNDTLTTRLVALWPIGLLLLLLMLGRQRRTANRYLLIVLILPVAAVFSASLVASDSRSLAEVRYFSGAVPVLFLLLAAGLTTVVTSRFVQRLAIGVLLATMVGAVALQQTSTDNPRLYQYREAVEWLRSEAEPGDAVVFAPFYLNYVLEYYNPGIATTPSTEGTPTTTDDTQVFLVQAASFAESKDGIDQINAIRGELESRGLRVEGRHDFAQITILELG